MLNKYEFSQVTNRHEGWGNSLTEEQVRLLNGLTPKARRLSLSWILVLHPDDFTEELVGWLNETADTIELWLPRAAQRVQFSTIKGVQNLFAIITLLHNQKIQTSSQRLQATFTSVAEGFDPNVEALTHKCAPYAYYLYAIKQSLDSPELLNQEDIRSDLNPNISLSQFETIEPILHSYNNHWYSFASSLTINRAELESTQLLPNFLEALESFQNTYLVVADGQLKPEFYASENHLRAYQILMSAYDAYCISQDLDALLMTILSHASLIGLNNTIKTNLASFCCALLEKKAKLNASEALSKVYVECCNQASLEPLYAAVRTHAGAIGLNNIFKSKFASFCHTLVENSVKHVLLHEPNTSLGVFLEIHPDGYWLESVDISVGLTWLADHYKTQKPNNPQAPNLTFLPIVTVDLLPELLSDLINARQQEQAYVGVYSRNANHWVFQFVYKWPSGRTTVILIDSAPGFSAALEHEAARYRQFLPGCDVIPLSITQQLNSSDCGYCALQNVEDVVNSLLSTQNRGFLQFRDPLLQIDTSALTLNAERSYQEGLPLLPTSRRVKNKWEARFKSKNSVRQIMVNSKKTEGDGVTFIDGGQYDFDTEVHDDLYEKYFRELREEFQRSSEFKELKQEAMDVALDLDSLNALMRAKYYRFKAQSQVVRRYQQTDLERFFPERLDRMFLADVISAKILKPIMFDRMADSYISTFKSSFFANDIYLDRDGQTTQAEKKIDQQLFNADWEAIFAVPAYAGFRKFLKSKILEKTHECRKDAKSLSAFRNQPLTYAMLKQWVDIWENDALVSHRYFRPPFVKKVQKIYDQRPDDVRLQDEVSPDVVTSLSVSIRYWRNNGSKLNPRLVRAVDALESTQPLSKKQNDQSDDQPEVLPNLREIKAEIEALKLNHVSEIALCVLLTLERIEGENAKSDAENGFRNSVGSCVTLTRPQGVSLVASYIHLERCRNLSEVKAFTNEIVKSFKGAYKIAKAKNEVRAFLLQLGNTLCIQGSLRPALNWVALADSYQPFSQIMEKAYDEATAYLSSTGKSFSIHNITAFISKHYIGTKCLYRPKDDDLTKPFFESTVTKRMIGDYLKELDDSSTVLKKARKNSLVDIFNNHDLRAFKRKLGSVGLDTPGVNQQLPEGETLLTAACQEGKLEHARILLSKGVDITVCNHKGESPILLACRASLNSPDAAEIMHELIKLYPKEQRQVVAKSLLLEAYRLLTVSCFKYLLPYINDPAFLNASYEELDGLSFFTHSAKAENAQKKQYFLENLLALDILDHTSGKSLVSVRSPGRISNMSLLRFAVAEGSVPLTKALLSAIANRQHKERLAQSLLPYFVFPNPKYDAFLPILAVFASDDQIINGTDYGSETLLTRAILSLKALREITPADLVNIEALLNNNADPLLADANHKTPIQLACDLELPSVLALLLDKHLQRLDGNRAEFMKLPQSLLKQEFDLQHHTIFFTLARHISDKKFFDGFYRDNLEQIKDSPVLLRDANLKQWKEAGLFEYVRDRSDELFALIEYAILHRQVELLRVFLKQAKAGYPDKLKEKLPELLLQSYHTDNHQTPKVIGELLSYVDDLNAPGLNIPKSPGAHTLLTLACTEKRHSFIRILINKGVNVQVKGSGFTPLQWAVSKKDRITARMLLDALSNESVTQMHDAIVQDDLLYKAYELGDAKMFNVVLSRVNNLNIPGIHLKEPRLPNNNGTYFYDNYRKGEQNPSGYDAEITKSLIARGFRLPQNVDTFTRKLSSIYDKLIAATVDPGHKTFLHKYFTPILRSTNIAARLHMAQKALSELTQDNIALDYKLRRLVNELKVLYERYEERLKTGYTQITVVQDPPLSMASLQRDTIAFFKTPRALYAYWIQDGELKNKSFEVADVQEILSELGAPGFQSVNKDLLRAVKTKLNLPSLRWGGHSCIHRACSSAELSLLKEYLNDPKEIAAAVRQDSLNGRTALHYAAANLDANYPDSLPVLESLLKNPSFDSCKTLLDMDGRLPLHLLCMKMNVAVLRSYAPDINTITAPADTAYLRTPLHYACDFNHVDTINFLLDAPAVQAQINAKDFNGHTALHFICEMTNPQPANDNQLKLISRFIGYGADCSLRDDVLGDTPLHLLCRRGKLDSIKALLNSETFFTALLTKNYEQKTPLEELSKQTDFRNARLIKEFLTPLFNLATRKAELSALRDVESQSKANAIDRFFKQLCLGDQQAKVAMLNTLDLDRNDLFKPRANRYGDLFKARRARDTKTAQDVDKLKEFLVNN